MKYLFILFLLFASCSSRKVIVDTIKKDSISETVVKTATVEDIKIETKNDISIDEFTITPLDSLKDIVINGISYKNVVLTYKKTKDNTLYKEEKKVSKIEDKQQTTKVQVKEKKKEIDKKANYFIILILLFIILLAYMVYKLKSKLFI
jgi:hypothetical protein